MTNDVPEIKEKYCRIKKAQNYMLQVKKDNRQKLVGKGRSDPNLNLSIRKDLHDDHVTHKNYLI